MNKTGIDWADMTWNPITGCTPVSEGCENCYAKRMAETRLRGRVGYSEKEPFKVTEHLDRLEEPLKIRKPQKIFVCSMGDLFHPDVSISFVAEVLNIMASWKLKCRKKDCGHEGPECFHEPGHTYIALTKRPERINEVLDNVSNHIGHFWAGDAPLNIELEVGDGYPLDNLWLGVSVENQKRADERIPELLEVPAVKRFVSIEPLLEPVDIVEYFPEYDYRPTYGYYQEFLKMRRANPGNKPILLNSGLDWVIVGAETGPGARPYKREWVQDIIDQCYDAGVPLFLKDNLKWEERIQKFPEKG